MNQSLEWILDRIWPQIYGKEEKPEQTTPEIPDIDYLDRVEKEVENLVVQEDERVRIVDRKMVSLMTFGSVASSVIIAGTIGAATLNIPTNAWGLKVLATIAVTFSIYIAVQLLNVVVNVTAGLSARAYKTQKIESAIPEEGETMEAYQRRLTMSKIQILHYNEWQTNRKVDKMIVAHVALKNAAYAAIVLALAVGGAAMWAIWENQTESATP